MNIDNQPIDLDVLSAACRDAETASLDLLCDLVSAAKVGRAAIDDIVTRVMTKTACDIERICYHPETVPLIDEFAAAPVSSRDEETCLIGRIAGDGSGRSLILFAHPDIETYRESPKWSSDPFVPTIRHGRLHGWGVADDLAGIAMLLQSAAVTRAAGFRPAGDLILVSAPSKAHRRGIAAALNHGVEADAAVYLHPAESGRGLDEIKGFSPGQLEFRIRVGGRPPETSEPAHTAFAHLAANPFEKAMIVVMALRDFDRERGATVHHPRLEQAIGRSTNLMISHCGFGTGEVLSRIPGECILGGALSLIPGEQSQDIMDQVAAAVAHAASTDPFLRDNPPEITWLAGVSAAETPGDHDLFKLAAATLERIGAAPEVNPLHTASDIRNPIVQKDIPTIGFGPKCGGLTMSGMADEWVDIADFHRAIFATVSIVAGWCGQAGSGAFPVKTDSSGQTGKTKKQGP